MPLRRSRITARSICRAPLLVALAAACGGDGGGGGATTGPTPGPTTAGISGRVVAGFESVAAATVTLTGAASRTATTDMAGSYAFASLPPGSYELALSLPPEFVLMDGASGTRTIAIARGEAATQHFAARRVSGSPIFDVLVSVTAFQPASLTLPVGTTVRWIIESGSHRITPADPSQPGVWTASGTLTRGQTFQHTFTVADTRYDYRCTVHAAMTGSIRIRP